MGAIGRNGGGGDGDGGGKGNRASGAWTAQADYGQGGWAKQPGAGSRPGRWAETLHTRPGGWGQPSPGWPQHPQALSWGPGTGLGSPEQRLEPADALRQGRPEQRQEPPGQRPVLGPGAARAPRQSGSLAGHPRRDGRGARGFGHGPGAPLFGCAGSGPCPRAVAGDRFRRRRTWLARRCARLAVRGFARPAAPPSPPYPAPAGLHRSTGYAALLSQLLGADAPGRQEQDQQGQEVARLTTGIGPPAAAPCAVGGPGRAPPPEAGGSPA